MYMLGSEYHHTNPPKERNQTALTMMVHGYNTLFGAMGLHVNYERGGEDGSVVRVFRRFSEGFPKEAGGGRYENESHGRTLVS